MQTSRQSDRQTDKQTDKQTAKSKFIDLPSISLNIVKAQGGVGGGGRGHFLKPKTNYNLYFHENYKIPNYNAFDCV